MTTWTFPPELLVSIIKDVTDGTITRKQGEQVIRDYLDELKGNVYAVIVKGEK